MRKLRLREVSWPQMSQLTGSEPQLLFQSSSLTPPLSPTRLLMALPHFPIVPHYFLLCSAQPQLHLFVPRAAASRHLVSVKSRPPSPALAPVPSPEEHTAGTPKAMSMQGHSK